MKLLIICAIILSGCTTTLPASKVQIPATLLQPCAPLEKLNGTTGQDLLENITKNSAIYWACKDSKDALIKATQ